MRASIYLISAGLALALALASCDGKGSDGDSCSVDTDCDSGTCARTDRCEEPDAVRAVHVTWTVRGAAPTADSCRDLDPLEIDFDDGGLNGDGVAFAPVPCTAGLYSIDKLPLDITRVSLGPQGSSFGATANIDAQGNAALDLP